MLRKYTISLLILVIGLFSLPTMAQNKPPEHQLGLKLGLGYGQVKDKAVSRMIYSGWVIPFGLNYQLERSPNRFSIGLQGYFSQPKSPFQDPALWLNYGLNLGYNKLVYDQKDWEIRLGAKIPFQTTVDFFEAIRAEYFYWLSIISVNPSLQIDKKIADNQYFFTAIHFPLFGLYSRPPAERFTNAEGSFSFILKATNEGYKPFFLYQNLAFNWQCGLHYYWNKKIEQRIHYEFHYLSNPNPERISLVLHTLNWSTYLNWKK